MIYAHENHKEITKKILELAHEFTEVTAKKGQYSTCWVTQ